MHALFSPLFLLLLPVGLIMVIGMASGKIREILFVYMTYLFLLVSASASLQVDKGGGGEEAEADRIIELPGQPKVSFQQYSGYVTVNKVAGRALFYWLTEAAHLPESKPLIIWFNGGPGCSSVAFGASEEIGPFKIKKKGTGLILNKYSWNAVANLLFIESPAGVGFSYTNTSSDLLTSGDQRTAIDALEFVDRWLDRFPSYKQREIYLAGESYAGHYVPQLAKEILTYNSKTKFPINLKGIMVGNALIDNNNDNLGAIEYMWRHAMISDETRMELLDKCDYHGKTNASVECKAANKLLSQELGSTDRYNIYEPKCNKSKSAKANHTIQHLRHLPLSILGQISGFDPCTVDYAKIYYNRPDVQKALHANTTKLPYEWNYCNFPLNEKWNDSPLSILPIYKEMIAGGLRIWVFSGDLDSAVPFTSTKFSLAQLNLTTRVPWYAWFVNNEVGGWTEVYEELTFATVRGAGHEVPLVRPKQALELFKSFLSGTPLQKSQQKPSLGADHVLQ